MRRTRLSILAAHHSAAAALSSSQTSSLTPLSIHSPQLSHFDSSDDPDSACYLSASTAKPPRLASPNPSTFIDFAALMDVDPLAVVKLAQGTLAEPGLVDEFEETAVFCSSTSPSARQIDRRLARSVRDAAIADKNLLIRSATTADQLRSWWEEVCNWQWSGKHELESLDPNAQIVIYGPLPAPISSYLDRVHAYNRLIDNLDMDHIKRQVLLLYFPDLPPDQVLGDLSLFSGQADLTKPLEDVPNLTTHFLMVSILVHASLRDSLDCWLARLSVLDLAPAFLGDLALASQTMSCANEVVDDCVDIINKIINKKSRPLSVSDSQAFLDSLDTLQPRLAGLIASLDDKLGKMLNHVPAMNQTIPDAWISRLDSLEKRYWNWAARFKSIRPLLIYHSIPSTQPSPRTENPESKKRAQAESTSCSSSEPAEPAKAQAIFYGNTTRSSSDVRLESPVVMRIIKESPALVDVSTPISTPVQQFSSTTFQDSAQSASPITRMSIHAVTDRPKTPTLDLSHPKIRFSKCSPQDAAQTAISPLKRTNSHPSRQPSMTSNSSSESTSRPSDGPFTPNTSPNSSSNKPTIRQPSEDHAFESGWSESAVETVDILATPKRRQSTTPDSSPSLSPPEAVIPAVIVPKCRARAEPETCSSNSHQNRSRNVPQDSPPQSPSRSAPLKLTNDLNAHIGSALKELKSTYRVCLVPETDHGLMSSTPAPKQTSSFANLREVSKEGPCRRKASYQNPPRHSTKPLDSKLPVEPNAGLSPFNTNTQFTLVPDSQIGRMPTNLPIKEALRRNKAGSARTPNLLMNQNNPNTRCGVYHLVFPVGFAGADPSRPPKVKTLLLRHTDGHVFVRVGGGWEIFSDWLMRYITKQIRLIHGTKSPLIRSPSPLDYEVDGAVETDDEGQHTFTFSSVEDTIRGTSSRTMTPVPMPATSSLTRKASRQLLLSSTNNRRISSNPIGSPHTGEQRASLAGPVFQRSVSSIPISDEGRQWMDDLEARVKKAGPGTTSSMTVQSPPQVSSVSNEFDSLRINGGAITGTGSVRRHRKP